MAYIINIMRHISEAFNSIPPFFSYIFCQLSLPRLSSGLCSSPPLPPPPPSSANNIAGDIEAAMAPQPLHAQDNIDHEEAAAMAPQPQNGQDVPLVKVNMGSWSKLIVGFCLASAIAIAIISIQNYQLSLEFYLISVALELAFTFFLVADFINDKYTLTIVTLKKFGMFFGAAAFFVAIAILLPVFLKCITGFISVISIAVILTF